MLKILSLTSEYTVCVKPVGVPSQGEGADAMPALLAAQLGGTFYPVHRLDQTVGGVMVYARTPEAAAKLTARMQQGDFRKEYLAVLTGVPAAPAGELTDLLFHDRTRNKTYVVDRKRAGVKEARLAYEVLGQAENLSLVRVRLFTGRTHQIRVQFASRKLPLLGDGKYGSRDNRCSAALWSYRLTFSGQTFSALPEGFPWTLFSVEGLSCM